MQSIVNKIVVHVCMVSMDNKIHCLWYAACLRTLSNTFLFAAMTNPYVINAITKTHNFNRLIWTPNYMCVIAKALLSQPTTLFYAGVHPLQRSRITFWQVLTESRSYEYIASGKNLKRPHSPKTQRNITKIAGHVRMGVINDKIIWLWYIGCLWRNHNWILVDFDMFFEYTHTTVTPKTHFVQFLHN